MGKRGPSPGAKYKRRPLAGGSVVVVNDRQLLDAQHFCDRLDAVLAQIERGDYPAELLTPRVRERLRLSAEAVQHSVIAGIERFLDKNRYDVEE